MTSVRLFEDYVELAMGLPPSTCATSGRCGAYFVVEGDGSVYPCDFYALDRWKLGNLLDTPLEALGRGERAEAFLRESLHRPCRMHRLPVAVSLLRGLPAGLDHQRRGHCAQLEPNQ